MNFRIALRELGPHNVSLLPVWTKLAWLCSRPNENHITETIPERGEQPGFTPFQPMCIFVRGPVSQTHTPFMSLLSHRSYSVGEAEESMPGLLLSLLPSSRIFLKRTIRQWRGMHKHFYQHSSAWQGYEEV